MTHAEHWLYRLDAQQWLAAAERELSLGEAALPRRRVVLTHARRGAGMALNAVLVAAGAAEADPATIWGRSYVDHLRRIADSAPLLGLPVGVRELAGHIMGVPITAPQKLVALRLPGTSDVESALEAARQLSAICTRAVEGS